MPEPLSYTPAQHRADTHTTVTGLGWDDRAPLSVTALVWALAGIAALALGLPIGFAIVGWLS